jgi:uncharacterized membrane protein
MAGSGTPRSVMESTNQIAGEKIRPRLDSVDLLRGTVMALMALDHTRDFFSNITHDPLDLKQTFPALFLVRWITHYCAPVFVFLAGTGACLSMTRGRTTRDLSWYLVSRGLWLVVLELTYVNWCGWAFDVSLHWFGGSVIWAIGWSMVALAGLVWLPVSAVTSFGVAMILLHNAFDGVKPGSFGAWAGLWQILHAGGVFELAPGVKFGAGYPLIPWIGVMAAGYGFGSLWKRGDAERRSWLLKLGFALTSLFVLVRATNFYGDPTPWSSQKSGLFTLFSFLHCEKYPPSLCYLLMTLGPAICILAWYERGTPVLMKPLLVFGRVPLFYYLLHLPLIHGMAVGVNLLRFGRADWLYGFQPALVTSPPEPPPGAGFGLAGVFFFWLLALVLLYPVCRWFAVLKQRRKDWWLGYL